MTRTTTYVIYRIGSNAANQSMTHQAILGTVTAASRTEAIEQAPGTLHATVYNNQHLDAVPISRVSLGHARTARELDAERIAYQPEEDAFWAEIEAEATRTR